jgi:hypothetical protein
MMILGRTREAPFCSRVSSPVQAAVAGRAGVLARNAQAFPLMPNSGPLADRILMRRSAYSFKIRFVAVSCLLHHRVPRMLKRPDRGIRAAADWQDQVAHLTAEHTFRCSMSTLSTLGDERWPE